MKKEELIKKHLEGWSGLQKSSIDHFAETGKASGSFFMALKAMLDEHAENVVKNNLAKADVSGSLFGKNAILYSKVDREDAWVCGGLVFKVKNTQTYEDAYNEIKHKLESPELIAHIIEDRCLLDDLFDGDESYKFVRTYWDMGLVFVFENSEGEEQEHRYSEDFVWLA